MTVLIAVAGLFTGFVLCWLLMRGRGAVAAPQARPEAQAELAQANERVRKLELERQTAVKNYEDLKQQTAREQRAMSAAGKPEKAQLADQTAQLSALQAELTALLAQEKASRAEADLARSQAQTEQTQAKDYFRALEQKQQLAAAEHKELQQQLAASRQALEQVQQAQAQLAERAARLPALEQENETLKRNAAALVSAPQARPAARPAQATQLPALEEQVVALQNLEKAIKKEFQLLAELQRNVTLTSATRHEFNESPESRTNASAAA